MKTDRRQFVRRTLCAGASLALAPMAVFAEESQTSDRYDQKLIKEFVTVGHGNLERVKEMLAEYPNLLNCTWDWGGGDFETAIGGAGHVGNTDIANYLIAAGARVNLFVLTMLGRTELVRPVLEAYPELVFASGPHGFTMLHHAEKGGEDAAELFEYLQSRGLRETRVTLTQ